ncbi:MAG: L-threonylcarbamoyladenylate synthase [Lachnospiraceae bacterium]|nr:L-threonylcarbamoyladenylate synthase [Lachnospiraceae bacterium]
MQTIKMDMTSGIDAGAMKMAGQILKDGGLVAFPTETVYGLGGNALDAAASAKIYAAKGRPSDNPLIVHIADFDALDSIVKEIPETARKLAEAFWPGPLTMIFRKSDLVPYETTGGLETVAVRMPNHPAALALIREGGGYVAAPSANTSGRPSPTKASHVADDLDGKINAIIDGGDVGIGLESTIVDLTEAAPVILRPGYVNQEMLRQVIGPVELDQALLRDDPNLHPKAPGMKYRHYAPKASLTIVEGTSEAVTEKIKALAAAEEAAGHRAGIIATDETAALYPDGIVKSAGTRADEITIAMHLYNVLREFDELEVSKIFSEAFETPQMGQAIMNRLIKAAGHQIINV